MEVKSLLRHVLSNSGEKKRFCYVILGSKLRVEHIAAHTQMIRRFCKEVRSTEHVYQSLPSHAFRSHWACSRSVNNTSTLWASVCALLRCGQKRESGVTDVVFGLLAECREAELDRCRSLKASIVDFYQFLWRKVDDISYDFYQASTLKRETELVDPLKAAMVHEHPPIADRLGRYSRFVHCDHDRPTWEKRQKRWYNLLPFPFPAILMGVCAFGVGHWTHSRRALGIWKRGPKSTISDSLHRSLWDSVRDGLLYHSQLTTTASAVHRDIAIQPDQEVAHKKSSEHKNLQTADRCNCSFQ